MSNSEHRSDRISRTAKVVALSLGGCVGLYLLGFLILLADFYFQDGAVYFRTPEFVQDIANVLYAWLFDLVGPFF